ncbi:16S rRNA (cytidine(1402)-2'-O)-methyltransferase [Bacillus canaveralius]|uniref:16S rRNA (cytidine(1402)-2'-O)-methyltransferase n=1 Tax=Bacillus canaveralius TaxID=1403243 RepID=UPI000F7758F0|nr:16S rRNA (cytidine(1402)-2'-O)-methyltransferase [Bacillus canaveralius]RSK56850.1 16S rRNA (cytidine(1402)-2'-O)-methyltransferase [Bacillus canaveralius]
MWQQKSFQNEESKGILYLVPTPIGNLEDMSFRAVRILKEVDFIAAEDTRNTKKLCHYFEIDTPLMSHHEHNKDVSGEKIVKLLKNGAKIALVSDAGMPAISDPGYELVKKATEEQLTVVSLPGANAALTALIASGLATQPFYFYGFLSRHKKEKRKELEELGKQTATLLIYEAPHRLKDTLQLMAEVLGERKIVLCRELTKKYEELIRGTIAEAMDWANREEVRGEFCLVVEGGSESASDQQLWWDRLTIKEHIEHYISEGMAPKDAIKQTAKDRNIQKRDVYHVYHIES